MNKPTASLRNDGRYEAKGIDPATGKRKSYYSRGDEGASAIDQAWRSFGHDNDRSFGWYFANGYVPSIKFRTKNWKSQVAWAMDRWWLPWFADVPIDAITRSDVQHHFNTIAAKLSPKSVSNVYKVVSGIFSLAEVDGAIVRTPCLKIRLPAIGEADKTALSFAELWRLKEAAHPLIKPFVLLSGFCSLRLGEAVGQTRHAISDGLLEVRQQIIHHADGEVEITERLKTPHSRRIIPLPDGLATELYNCGQVSSVWVCSDTIGGHIAPKNVIRELAIACRRAGLIERDAEGNPVLGPDEKPRAKVSPNELRHTFISLMENELGAPQRIVERLAGKAKKGKTAPYSHTEVQQLRRWMEAFWDAAEKQASTELTTGLVVRKGQIESA